MRTQNDMLWVAGIILSAGGLAGGCVGVPEPGLVTEGLVTFGVNSPLDYPDSNLGDGICRAVLCDTPTLECCTLRAAIMEANADPTTPRQIDLRAGVYRVSIPPTPGQDEASGDLDLLSNQIIIRGLGPGRTRIVASSGERVFHAQYCESASLMDLSIEGGRAAMGGGLLSDLACHVRLENVRVAENTAELGGGLANGPEATMELEHVDLRANHATKDGGAVVSDGAFTMAHSTVAHNTSDNGTAGAALRGNISLVYASTFSGNEANWWGSDAAGALHVEHGAEAFLFNVTVSENDGFPGGLLVTGRAALTHVTIADNQIGIENRGETTMEASIVYDPAYPNCVGRVNSLGHNVENGDTCGLGATGDQSRTDPLLGPLAADMGPTMVRPLDNGSPAIDLLPPIISDCHPPLSPYCPPRPEDQRGVPRAGYSDAGAYEYAPEDRFCVDSLGDDVDTNPGDGACLTSRGECTLRAAVMETNALPGPDMVGICVRGTILLTRRGTHEDGAATGDLDILDDVVIHGRGSGIRIDGQGADRIFDVGPNGRAIGAVISRVALVRGTTWEGFGGGVYVHHAASLRVTRATIQECESHLALLGGSGGAILSQGVLDLDGVTIQKNLAVMDGGAVASGGVVRITSSRLYSNAAERRGGALFSEGFAEIVRTTFEANRATDGGGVYTDHRLAVLESTLTRNWAARWGGGVYAAPAWAGRVTTRVERSTFFDNAADAPDSAGALDAKEFAEISNSTISGHHGSPALELYRGARLTNVTLAYNDLGLSGGRAPIQVVNSILDSCDVRVTSLGHNIDMADTCGLSHATDWTNTDPILYPLVDNGGPTWTHEFRSDSRAMDGGDDVTCPLTDQRGVERYGICDIGAYEVR